MKAIIEKEKRWLPILGSSNLEEVEITWETRVLDDGYVVVEMLDYVPIAEHYPLQ